MSELETLVGGYVSTAATIRDRIYSLIESITPTSLTRDAFRRYRNEGGADFRAWAEAHPNAALRRFQVRRAGTEEGPDVSNIDVERVRVMFEIVIAYPQTHRYGADNAMDRDDVMDEDCRALDAAVGLYSRGNFSDSHDCTPLTSFGAAQDREEGEGVDFMVIEAQYEFVRATRVA